MKLYDLPASPNARRVRIFIAEKGLDIPTQAIDMANGENQQADFLAKNSLGKMPVLELKDGTCITESAAICRYLPLVLAQIGSHRWQPNICSIHASLCRLVNEPRMIEIRISGISVNIYILLHKWTP